MGSGRLGDGFGDLLIKKTRKKKQNIKKERKKERERENIHWKKGPMGPMGPMGPWPHGPHGPMGPWAIYAFNFGVGLWAKQQTRKRHIYII